MAMVNMTTQELFDARNAVRSAILRRQQEEKAWDRYAGLMGTLDLAWTQLPEQDRSLRRPLQ